MLTEEQRARILELHKKGLSKNRIAKELGVSWDTVNKVIKEVTGESRETDNKIGNLREEFERISRIAEYEVELKRTRKEIEREKEVADEYKLYKLEILEKKVDWVIKNVEDCDEEIMERIRAEFKETIGIPCKEIVDEMIESYKEVKEFERQKGMSIEEMKAFVEEHSDLILDMKKLRRQVKALKKDVESLNRQRDWLSKEVGMLGNVRNARDKGFQLGYNYAIQRFGIWYYCSVCNQPILIEANSNVHQAIIEFLRSQGWGHAYCHQMYKGRGYTRGSYP